MAVGVAASPALAAAVDPVLISGNPQPVCPEGSTSLVALRVDPNGGETQGFDVPIPGDGTGHIDVTFSQVPGADPDTQVAFVTSNGISVNQATVKGGPNANRYIYNSTTGFPNGIMSDSGLVSPINPGGQLPTISHVDFCFVPTKYT
ncbi:hypothetical protein [Streptomyces sp. NRRL S-813]|uniref:hypothetical protein n=1 Tax=Streptomyces sp. NRRL S-813 TaxID=1463919 RepID=UPI0004C0407D|nr:hypothetical protein [Streptomyces sp. NRRL S-813]